MNDHERSLLDLAKSVKKTYKRPEYFKSWLVGFRKVGRESEELKREFNKLI